MNKTYLASWLAWLISTQVMANPIDFVKDVRPILQKHCYRCHGPKRQKSGLRLDIKQAVFKGGDVYGPSIKAGKSAKSPLIQFIRDEKAEIQMPPSGKRLSKSEIETLTTWVNEGARWPDNIDEAKLVDRRNHWSFKPVKRPSIPRVKNEHWPRNAIDYFILSRLEHESLQPAPEANSIAWLRRVYFDLIGLPPTPTQVHAFISDQRSDAYERVVDQLLDSPRYGERWAQHWLDVVRYADTHGFEVNTERPNAWPYRDYVIEALNKDTPYDQFIREQIFGDALDEDRATGFLVTASVLLPGQIGKDEPSKRLARQDALDEIVNNIGQTFLGLSIGCARCHDHKFDPISQQDYYSMQAFVAGVEYADRSIPMPDSEDKLQSLHQQMAQAEQQLAKLIPSAQSNSTRAAVNARLNLDRFTPIKTRKLRFSILRTNKYEPCIDELEVFNSDGENIARNAKVTTSGSRSQKNRHELRFVNDGHYGNTRSWMSNEVGKGWVQLEFDREHAIHLVSWSRDRQEKYTDRLAIEYRIEVADDAGQWQTVSDFQSRKTFNPQREKSPIDLNRLNGEMLTQAKTLLQRERELVKQMQTHANGGQLVFAGTFRKPDVIRLLRRGDPEQPQALVRPAVMNAIGSLKLSNDTKEQERRRALAAWITRNDNPLTARVMVNRIWQGHFGFGLVSTPNDFGWNGTKPSHPALLDWLATEFIRSGWSMKKLHRLIVLSSTYRQSTQANHPDADERLLWRYPSRRLDGETIRDSLLSISGHLHFKMGGKGFNLFDKRGGLTGFNPIETFKADGLRRLIYAHKVRRERDPVFGTFDCPDGGQSMPRRRESTTPIQALNLLNSRFVLDRSKAFARRVRSEVGSDLHQQIQRAYQLVLSRDPTVNEMSDANSIVAKFGLTPLCRALFNCNEFLFIP